MEVTIVERQYVIKLQQGKNSMSIGLVKTRSVKKKLCTEKC